MKNKQPRLARTLVPSLLGAVLFLGSLCIPKPAAPSPCPPEMIAYWWADSDATDHMLNHDGTMMGGATFGDGHCEGAFSLDGVDDCVSIPSSSDFNLSPTDDKSIVLWWKAAVLGGPLVTRRDSDSYDGGLLLAIEPSNYYLHLRISYWAKYSVGYTIGQWYQVAITKDGTDWKLYQNGSEIPISSSYFWPFTEDYTKNVPLLLGQDGATSLPNFDGSIDEVAVYNKALSPKEVLALYQSSCHYCDGVITPTPSPTPEGYKTPIPSPSPSPGPTCGIAHWKAVIADGDYDGDGTDEAAFFRMSSGRWYIFELTRCCFGNSLDQPVPGDYDGNGTADIAVFRPSTGLWAAMNLTRVFIGSAGDLAVPGDYDGDGICDIGIFRESQGLWSILFQTRFNFGAHDDRPIPWTYKGDGTSAPGLYRGSSGQWMIRDFTRFYFGTSLDWPIPGNYFGASEEPFTIYRGNKAMWAIRNLTSIYWGGIWQDRPCPADYNGDGVDDICIYRDGIGLWAVRVLTRFYFGGHSDDIPVTR